MKGIGASPGIAIGKAFVLQKQVVRATGISLKDELAVQREIERFEAAVRAAVDEVEAIRATLPDQDDGQAILEVQIELLSDEQIRTDVVSMITGEYKNANDAMIGVAETVLETFRNMEDEYFRARMADVGDAANRILRHLNAEKLSNIFLVEENTIIIAEDIAPSDMIALDITKVSGFVTRAGSRTSHAAIIAKARGLPAVVGCGASVQSIRTHDIVIVDGTEGVIVVQPSQEMIAEYVLRKKVFVRQTALLHSEKDVPAVTTDGVEIKLLANISNAADMEASFNFGGEGCGLLRTELLFMGRTAWPEEEEQFEFYKSVALKAKGRPVIIRTLDIGGDKQLPYFNLPVEQNPFLGYRAIRICLDRQEIFTTQLRAILRAGIFGELKIMLPMISNVQEVRRTKVILEEVKAELSQKGIAFKKDMALGIMIEIPSAAVTADILAREVDFFSIGTNDLCQYTLAVDRMNEQVKELYDPYNPGVLRLIRTVIEQGDKQGIHTGMCGELAGDVLATLLLLGMGLREFSMSASSIPHVKNVIIHHSMAAARELCRNVMALDNSQAIVDYLKEVSTQ